MIHKLNIHMNLILQSITPHFTASCKDIHVIHNFFYILVLYIVLVSKIKFECGNYNAYFTLKYVITIISQLVNIPLGMTYRPYYISQSSTKSHV